MELKRKFLTIFLLSFLMSQMPISAPRTHAFWGEFVQENYHFLLKKIDDTITGTILSTLKQQAMKMINEQMNKIIGGVGGGGAKFITDWRSYIVKDPEDLTKLFMNDRLTQMTKGKGSATGYLSSLSGSPTKSASGSLLGEGFGKSGSGNYASQLVNMAKGTVVDPKLPTMTYEGDPSQMFASGNFKDMNLYLSGINNPWSFQMNAAAEKQKRDEEEKRIATARAVANNAFKSVGEGAKGKGTITMPGSLIKDIAANAQDIGNKILASATHPEEIITAMVTQMMNKALQMGIGQVQQMVNKQVDGTINKMNSAINKAIGDQGPGAIFKTQNQSSTTQPGSTTIQPSTTTIRKPN